MYTFRLPEDGNYLSCKMTIRCLTLLLIWFNQCVFPKAKTGLDWKAFILTWELYDFTLKWFSLGGLQENNASVVSSSAPHSEVYCQNDTVFQHLHPVVNKDVTHGHILMQLKCVEWQCHTTRLYYFRSKMIDLKN